MPMVTRKGFVTQFGNDFKGIWAKGMAQKEVCCKWQGLECSCSLVQSQHKEIKWVSQINQAAKQSY